MNNDNQNGENGFHLSNEPMTRDQMLSTVGSLGTSAGVGRDALANVALQIAQGVQYGVFNASGVKKQTDADTLLVWDTYVAGETKLAEGVERSANAVTKAISQFQQIANASHKLSKMTPERFFAADVMAPVAETRKALRAEGVEVKPLFDAFVSAARLQFGEKQETVISAAQIDKLVRKAVRPEAGWEDKVSKVRKAAEKLAELLNYDEDIAALADIDAAFERILQPKVVEMDKDEAAEQKRKADAYDAWQKAEAEKAAAAAELKEQKRLQKQAEQDARVKELAEKVGA